MVQIQKNLLSEKLAFGFLKCKLRTDNIENDLKFKIYRPFFYFLYYRTIIRVLRVINMIFFGGIVKTKLKMILKINSSLIFIVGIAQIIPLIYSIVMSEGGSLVYNHFLAVLLTMTIGCLFYFPNRDVDETLNMSMSMILCAISWLMISLIGGIIFVLILKISFIDAFFESVSGFTTTGITVLSNLDAMPGSVLLWRSMIQWLGGLGIITFFLFVTFKNEGNLWQLISAESHKINTSRPVPNIYRTIKLFWLIYSIYTLTETVILTLLGMPLFDAVLHSLTTLSTGGFSNHDASIGYYALNHYKNAVYIEYTIIFFMLLGGVNFFVHFKWFSRKYRDGFGNEEFRGFLKIIGVAVLVILVAMGVKGNVSESAFRKTLFQVVSVITTTGFGTEDIGSAFFPTVAKQIFVWLMIIGGCVGSTSGGIKVVRVMALERLFNREFKRIYYPKRAIMPVKIDGSIVEKNELYKLSALFFGWLLIIVIGSMITAVFSDLGPFEALSGMTSALGNIGPFYFSVEKMASLNLIVKINFIVAMLMGRLEIIPVILLFSRRAWQS